MRRISAFLFAYVVALIYTIFWGAPILGGQAGPCSVRVHCPESSGSTQYYYELESRDLYKSIHVDYSPGDSAAGDFRDLPPGDYELRCGGVVLENLTLTLSSPKIEIWPDGDWPVFPPK